AYGIEGYRIIGGLAHDAASNPMAKSVARATGAWLDNYRAMPITVVAPALGFAGALIGCLGLAGGRAVIGFIGSTTAVIGGVATAGVSMFPFILPSSLDPRSSLTVWDASSSRTTLIVMLVAALIFVPIILAYTAYVYNVVWGKVTTA
ncbi:cytochrome d ubiquinol oxidase subunit II, partial [Leclercia adecarboxylata]|uniref:cytochrome d ubiquinol oxidase subunit II n=1 Tax=Leclercia adecarboxylata TaxID=83655 RepID=UPI00234D303F